MKFILGELHWNIIFHILIFKLHQRTRGIGLSPYFVLQIIVCFELGIVGEYILIYVHNFMCVTLLVLIVLGANLGATYLCYVRRVNVGHLLLLALIFLQNFIYPCIVWNFSEAYIHLSN
jgi:hypothetical protein